MYITGTFGGNNLDNNNLDLSTRPPKSHGGLSLTGLKGMTILEVSIALMIVSIVIVGILGGIYHASRFNALARNRLKANQIAQAKLEEIKNMDYAGISDSGPEENSLLQGTTTVRVTEQAEGKVVKIIVDWDKPGSGLPEELVTLIREP